MFQSRLKLLGVLGAIVVSCFALGELRIGSRTDGNGVLLSRYSGVYGLAGGWLVEVATVEGWPIVHAVDREGEQCSFGRPAPGGVALVGPFPDVTSQMVSSYRQIRLSSDGTSLVVSAFGFVGTSLPRRPRYLPMLSAMWDFGGKSSTLHSCDPNLFERVRLYWLALTDSGR